MSLREGRPLRASWLDDRGEHEIYLDRGEVLHARYGELEGPAAVFQMLDDPPRAYNIEQDRTAPQRSVFASWARLCHAARCELLDAPRASAG
ncbi:MAG: DUF4388 domain-containing protein [Deltaproteobacteria bacterium]|nr:DUF4388 domain-containing protein [Nannocystaceae bacterium]